MSVGQGAPQSPPATHNAGRINAPDAATQRFARMLQFRTLSSPTSVDHIKPGHEEEFAQLLHFMEEQVCSHQGLGNQARTSASPCSCASRGFKKTTAHGRVCSTRMSTRSWRWRRYEEVAWEAMSV